MTRNFKISISIVIGLVITVFAILPPVFGVINANRFKLLNQRLNEFANVALKKSNIALKKNGTKKPNIKFKITNIHKGMYHSTADLVITGSKRLQLKPIKLDFYNGPIIFKNGIHFNSGLLQAEIPISKIQQASAGTNIKNVILSITSNYLSSYDIKLSTGKFLISEDDKFHYLNDEVKIKGKVDNVIFETKLNDLKDHTLQQAFLNSQTKLEVDGLSYNENHRTNKQESGNMNLNLGKFIFAVNLDNNNTINYKIKDLKYKFNSTSTLKHKDFMQMQFKNFSIENIHIPTNILQAFRQHGFNKGVHINGGYYSAGGNVELAYKRTLKSIADMFDNQTAIKIGGFSLEDNMIARTLGVSNGEIKLNSDVEVTWPKLKKNHTVANLITQAQYKMDIKVPTAKFKSKYSQASLTNLEFMVDGVVRHNTNRFSTGPLEFHYIPLGQLHPTENIAPEKIKQMSKRIQDITISVINIVGKTSSKDDVMTKNHANINIKNICINKQDCFTVNGISETYLNHSDKTMTSLLSLPNIIGVMTQNQAHSPESLAGLAGLISYYDKMFTKNSYLSYNFSVKNKAGKSIKENIRVTFPQGHIYLPHITGTAEANINFVNKFPVIAEGYKHTLKTLVTHKCFQQKGNGIYTTNIATVVPTGTNNPPITLNSVNIRNCLSQKTQHATINK